MRLWEVSLVDRNEVTGDILDLGILLETSSSSLSFLLPDFPELSNNPYSAILSGHSPKAIETCVHRLKLMDPRATAIFPLCKLIIPGTSLIEGKRTGQVVRQGGSELASLFQFSNLFRSPCHFSSSKPLEAIFPIIASL